MSLIELEALTGEIAEAFFNLPENYGFIAYICDKDTGGYGTGFDRNVDTGDAMVAIKRIIEQFDIDIDTLAYALRQQRRRGNGNGKD
jgi:hypothetical protein